MATYKHRNGHLVQRSANGRFRKTTMADMGITDANTEGIVFICNVCGREFVPLVLSGKCCDVDDKRMKEIVVTEEEKIILNKMTELSARPFINRQILEELNDLNRQLIVIKQKGKQ